MSNDHLRIGENKVTFKSDGKVLSGLLYIPDSYKEGASFPAMAIARPASGVKEQTAGLYAKKFSEKGYIALAFDPKGFGDSEGIPQMEDPFSVISDNRNAYTFLASLRQVDAEKLVSVGICMGAGHAVAASSNDHRIKATIAISPYLTSHIDYPKAFGGKVIAKAMMSITNPLINLFKLFGIYFYIPIVPFKQWMQIIPATETQEGMKQYYGDEGKPGHAPNWKNRGNFYRASHIMTGKYNPFDFIKHFIPKPFFMAYADGGYSISNIKEFYDCIPASSKELVICEKATHFDLYYKPEFVEPIVEKVDAFLSNQL